MQKSNYLQMTQTLLTKSLTELEVTANNTLKQLNKY